MEYRIGNSKKIFEKGQTLKIKCPKCNNDVKFSIFTNLDTQLVTKLPVVKLKNVYFLICPECASAFTVDSKIGKEFVKGKATIEAKDLKELNKY